MPNGNWSTPRANEARGSAYQRDQGRTGAERPTLTGEAQLWPTPTTENFRSRGGERRDEAGLDRMARLWPTPAASLPQDGETPRTFLARRESLRAKGINGNGCGTPLAIEAQLWATPQAVDAGTPRAPRLKKDREHRPADTPGSYRTDLKDQAATWSTPRASDGEKGGPNMSFGAGGTPLPAQAATWATPTARDGKDGYLVSTATPMNRLLGRQVLTITRAGDGGSNESRALNPRFVEALMGWPPGWSEAHPRTPTASNDCAFLETGWCRWWRRMRSELSALVSTPNRGSDPADLFATMA